MLAAAGITALETFGWFEKPESAKLDQACGLLLELGALDSGGNVTETGRKMVKFPLHPRYARMLIEADRYDVVPKVVLVAGLSQGRAFYRVSKEVRVRKEQVRQIEDVVDHRSDYFVHLRALELAQAARFDLATCSDLGRCFL